MLGKIRKPGSFVAIIVFFMLPGSRVQADSPPFWQPTLDTAQRVAAQTQRLVLVYFHADWCRACMLMDQEVFSDPEIAGRIQAGFVPVRINVDHFPLTARQYGVTVLPTTVVIVPHGALLGSIPGHAQAAAYLGQLEQIVANAARRSSTASPQPSLFATGPQVPRSAAGSFISPPAPQHQAAEPDRAPWAASPSATTPPPIAPPAVPPASVGYAPGAQSTAISSAAKAQVIPTGHPPLGLDGCCPVTLVEQQKWVAGDRRWGAIHRGRTYLFAGADEQRRFLADPDRYAPVLSGYDVVAARAGRLVAGLREHGVFFDGHVYLFADEASLEEFGARPEHYADAAWQAMGKSRPQGSPSVREGAKGWWRWGLKWPPVPPPRPSRSR